MSVSKPPQAEHGATYHLPEIGRRLSSGQLPNDLRVAILIWSLETLQRGPTESSASVTAVMRGSAGSVFASVSFSGRMTVEVSSIPRGGCDSSLTGLSPAAGQYLRETPRGSTDGSRRQRLNRASAESPRGDMARSSATALPERVIVICSPRAARSTTSPPCLRRSPMLTSAIPRDVRRQAATHVVPSRRNVMAIPRCSRSRSVEQSPNRR